MRSTVCRPPQPDIILISAGRSAMATKSRTVQQPRHFLDLDALDAPTLRKIIDMAHAMKKAGKKTPAKFRPDGVE
ncbi:hypothetical protein MXD81_25605, partial [Microbacteriaceae bacterium K1510]|nr:hypothetical protein [Microbacteriaceae bacterium K1510]